MTTYLYVPISTAQIAAFFELPHSVSVGAVETTRLSNVERDQVTATKVLTKEG